MKVVAYAGVVLSFLVLVHASCAQLTPNEDELKAELRRRIERFKVAREKERERIRQETPREDRRGTDYVNRLNKYSERTLSLWEDILELGPTVIPSCFQGHEDSWSCGGLLSGITGFDFHRSVQRLPDRGIVWLLDEFPEARLIDSPSAPRTSNRELWLRWWREREEKTPIWFEQKFERYQECKENGNQEKTEQALKELSEIGIDGLPLIVKAIEDGHEDLIPALVRLANRPWVPEEKRLSENPTKDECLAWWTKNKETYRIPPYRPAKEDD